MAEISSILQQYPDYEVNIGIEIHVQLLTKSKIFCSCANTVAQEANTNICHICAGYPGVLPVLNKEVVHNAILAGLATNCTITPFSTFARKHYFYPDLPKNYQITQAEVPVCTDGFIEIVLEDGSTKKIRLIRIHMEEDAGKNIHDPLSDESFVNLNRTGTPLLEIVTHPDISSSYEAREYLKTLHAMVQHLGICSGNMEDGAFRGDTNISVRKKGAAQLGTKCELKNINSFKFIADAIEHEIERQITLLEAGGRVRQETRLWDDKNKKTIVMRSKEEAADYRYLEDPDLPFVKITPELIAQIKAAMPELPQQKLERFTKALGLTEYEANVLIENREFAQYFEKAYATNPSKQLINWILRDLMGYLKEARIELADCAVTPEYLAELVQLIDNGTINNTAAKEVFLLVAQTGKSPSLLVKEHGLEQIGSAQELEDIVKAIIAENPTQLEQYRAGKDKLFGFFVGQAMQKTKGKANAVVLQELFKKYLK